jgi:ABC-type uncharacterized transport system substrate-binding protein
MASHIGRRKFLATLGGAAAAWPLAARAQQSTMLVIGFLHPSSPDPYRPPAFRQGLKDAGFIEGENVAIEYRSADGQFDRLPALAAELVQRRVAVIATGGAASVFAAKAATTTIPIVFVVGEDPVRLGLVTSLARPGGNLTGINIFTSELTAKRLELLRELVPGAAHVAVLVNPADATQTASALRGVEPAARAMGLQFQVLNASTPSEIDAAFATMRQRRVGALFVGADPFLSSRRQQIVALVARDAIPNMYTNREFVDEGGLISYGNDTEDGYVRAGVYAGRILNGAKPTDLPVDQATKFELVVNVKAAKAIGLTIPESFLARADEVIE